MTTQCQSQHSDHCHWLSKLCLLPFEFEAADTLGQLVTLYTRLCWGRGLLGLKRNPMHPFFMMMMFLSTLSSSSPLSATDTLGQLMTPHSGLFKSKFCVYWGYILMFHDACDALVNIVYIITFRHTWSADDSAESERTVEGGALYSGLRHWVRTGFRWKTTQPSHPKIHADLMTMATLMRIVTTDQHIETFLPYYQPLLSDWLQMSQMSKAFVE